MPAIHAATTKRNPLSLYVFQLKLGVFFMYVPVAQHDTKIISSLKHGPRCRPNCFSNNIVSLLESYHENYVLPTSSLDRVKMVDDIQENPAL